MKLMKISCLLLLALSSISVLADEAEFKDVNLDQMIEHSMPVQKGTVELLLMNKVQFHAHIDALPEPRKTAYLLDVLANWRITPLPVVKQGMQIQSEKGELLNVYMEQSVAERATKQLNLGDEVTLLGYHVYNSKHGPGFLIADFTVQKTHWLNKFKALFAVDA